MCYYVPSAQMKVIRAFENLILPQHRAKRKLNNFIKYKKYSGFWEYYYTYVRDKYAVKYGVEIGLRASFDGPVNFPHPRNILIGEGVRIGKNLTIFNNVTIGQKKGKYPVVGDNVTIYSGVVIIGDIRIGNNVVIGANSLISKDIEDNVIVAGNPAKILKKVNKDEI